jgi:hypothetical protein
MLNRKTTGIAALMGAALLFATQGNAATITEGFENAPGSYNLAIAGGGSASIVTTTVHSGSQSLDLSLTTGSDYARVKLGESGLTLGAIIGADYWVYGTGASNAAAPYLLLSISCTGCGTDNTLAVMYNPIDTGINPTLNQWFDTVINPNTTSFHVSGNTTGIANPNNVTLAQLSSDIFSPGVTWGSFSVDFVRIGLGQESNDGVPYNYFVDDLTINTANATPLPSTWLMLLSGFIGIGFLAYRGTKKRAAVLAAT